MNYKESAQILEEIKKAKKILVNCHRQPDDDSVGSALAISRVLSNMGKTVKVVSPNEVVTGAKFLLESNDIDIVNYDSFNFLEWDMFITLDSSSWRMVVGIGGASPPEIPIIVIDHHKTNERYGAINLVDEKISSTGELLYWVFKDWKVAIDKDTATALLTGIIGDTGAFQYPGVSIKTFDVAKNLIEIGADKDKIIHNLFRSKEYNLLKFWGEVLISMQLDKESKFVWSAVPYEKFVNLGSPASARESSASLFTQVVDGTDFGFIMVEEEKNKLSISFRSRTGFDTSEIAKALGGGGHIYASGAKVEMPFDEAVNKVLRVAREYAKKS